MLDEKYRLLVLSLNIHKWKMTRNQQCIVWRLLIRWISSDRVRKSKKIDFRKLNRFWDADNSKIRQYHLHNYVCVCDNTLNRLVLNSNKMYNTVFRTLTWSYIETIWKSWSFSIKLCRWKKSRTQMMVWIDWSAIYKWPNGEGHRVWQRNGLAKAFAVQKNSTWIS